MPHRRERGQLNEPVALAAQITDENPTNNAEYATGRDLAYLEASWALGGRSDNWRSFFEPLLRPATHDPLSVRTSLSPFFKQRK